MKTAIIDGFGLLYRSHYAFPMLTTSTGLSSGCVYGFIVALQSLKKKWPNFHFIVAWDSKPVRKKELYAAYKENRSSAPLSNPLVDIRSILSCINVSQVHMQGEEADDVIASLVDKSDDLVYVFSGDKDLLQLVQDGKVVVVRPKSGNREEKFYDEEMVLKEFGVRPDGIAAYLAFRGDTVDNIPGIPRVKSSLISNLVNKYKNPQNIFDNIEKETLTPFQRSGFIANMSQVMINFQLTQLKRDLILELSNGSANEEYLQECLNKYEIKAVKPQTLIALFDKESEFSNRKTIQVVSLF